MHRRLFSTTHSRFERALVFQRKGAPASVIKSQQYSPLPHAGPKTLNLRVLLAPINPADLNVVEGSYPLAAAKRALDPQSSEEFFIPGNECLAVVEDVGPDNANSPAQKGDWVVMGKQQAGTWCSAFNISSANVVKVPRSEGMSEVAAATLTVNPATAYCLLHHFEKLKKGDWVVQNGANSAVGQAVIQIAKAKGFKTINLIRGRTDNDSVKNHLTSLGATHVATYEEMGDFKKFRASILELTNKAPIRLGLNCVSGPDTSRMAGLLGQDAQLISYGAMSKQPFQVPTSLFIFKDLICRGFWMSRWYSQCKPAQMSTLIEELTGMIKSGALKEPTHEIVTVTKQENDQEVEARIRKVFESLAAGAHGKKMLLRMEGKP